MITFKRFCLVIISLVLCACEQPQQVQQEPQIPLPNVSAPAIKAHVEFLAHDLLEGRETGKRGYDIAAQYVASQLAQLELTPAGNNNTYFQPIKLLNRFSIPAQTKMKVLYSDQTEKLIHPDEFILSGTPFTKTTEISAPLVFVGYGVSAPPLSHDDYANIDAKGKIVVLLNDKPKHLKSPLGAHYTTSQERQNAAVKHGAVGMIYLQTKRKEKRESFVETRKHALEHPPLIWLTKDNEPGGHIKALKSNALLSTKGANQLFNSAPHSYQYIQEQIDEGNSIPSFDMAATVTLSSASTHKTFFSNNVLGLLEGSDPKLKNEYILITAHLDQKGVEHDLEQEDKIHNGALDNAAGIGIIIEATRALAQYDRKRSVLLAFFTGEERGLMGADFFMHYFDAPDKKIVANINLDMPFILCPIGDVIAFGTEHSSLIDPVRKAVEQVGLQLSPDPMPKQNIFIRSDHYAFAKQGIPAVFLAPGFKTISEEHNGVAIFRKFLQEHYHKPSDDTSLPINYEAGMKFAQVLCLLSYEIANDTQRPSWNKESFFSQM